MPNWCSNELSIRGNKKQITKFKEKVKCEDSELSMDNIIPEPKDSKGEPSEDWYNWRCRNWGTKWDLEAELWDEGDDFLKYVFNSAWSPPDNFIILASKIFKKLSFQMRYSEEGMGFCGLLRTKKGFVVEDKYIDDGDFWDEEIEK